VTAAEPLVSCENVVHIYRAHGLEVVALQGLDLWVNAGEMVAVVGRSGSGKTTLLNVLAALDTPSAGRVAVAGRDLGRLTTGERQRYRREVVGCVWQSPALNLAPDLTVEQNVRLPMTGRGLGDRRERETAREVLDALGLGHRARRLPDTLSGGEQQRAGLAVALANGPALLLADEPTGHLDRDSAGRLMADLADVRRRLGTTVLVVTHDRLVERHVDRVVGIRDGRTSTETRRPPEDGEPAEELVIVDQAGRLQLPRAHLAAVGLAGRARVRVEAGRIVIEPPT